MRLRLLRFNRNLLIWNLTWWDSFLILFKLMSASFIQVSKNFRVLSNSWRLWQKVSIFLTFSSNRPMTSSFSWKQRRLFRKLKYLGPQRICMWISYANSFDFFLDKVLLVLGQSHGHDIVIVLDVSVHSLDSVLGVLEDLLTLLEIFKCALKVEPLLNLLYFFFTLLELQGNILETRGITDPGILGVAQKL